MPIIYSLVAHGSVILTEYSESKGNFISIAHQLIEKIAASKETKRSYVADSYTFNYLVRDEMTYLCLATDTTSKTIPFIFLDRIRKLFVAEFGQRGKATNVPYAMNADFAPTLQSEMATFSTTDESKLKMIQKDLDEVTGVMQENITKALDRGEQMDVLVVQTESLMDTSEQFRSNAQTLKQQMLWNKYKMQVAGVAILLLVLFLLGVSSCGGFTFPECG